WFTHLHRQWRRRAQIHPVIECLEHCVAVRTVVDEPSGGQVEKCVTSVRPTCRRGRALPLTEAMPGVTCRVRLARGEASKALDFGNTAENLSYLRVGGGITKRAFVFSRPEVALEDETIAN